MATTKSKLIGGNFLFSETDIKDVFIPEEFTEEQFMIFNMVRDFCVKEFHSLGMEKIALLDAEKDKEFVLEKFKKAAELGICGVSIPEEYGGMGLDFNTGLLFTEALSVGLAFATTIGAQVSIGSLPIVFYGTHEQKEKYLPKIASGEYACAYALTEPSSGSDANSAKSNAVLNEAGTHYLLNGQKMWITNGGFADIFIVFAKIDNDERLSAFIVEKEFGGIEIGKEEKKMGIKASSTVQLFFNNVPIPKENLLGERGKGFNMALNILNNGRIKIGAGGVGGIKFGLTKSVEYANQRIQFEKPISDFGAIKYKLGQMAMLAFVNESAVYRVGAEVDKKYKEFLASGATENDAKINSMREYAIECAILKVQGSDAVCWSADEAIQIHGGMGYSMETGVEMAYRDARITKIYEGTNEINRMLALAEFYKRAFQTKELKINDAMKTIPLGIAQNFNPFNNGFLADETEIVSNLKSVFMIITGAAGRKLKTKLVDEQEIVMNLADIMSVAFMAESAILRVKKLKANKDTDKEQLKLKTKMTQLYVYEALDIARKAADNAIDSYSSGVEKFTMKRVIGSLLKNYDINPKDTRRAIADAAIAANQCPF
ncbi:MAG TPA: acyl-CoA dehydrogenase family protein [Chitinophagales bacterium]|jgi:alkylation response protein AidB-like acyl-CoA dehydrogenase|nr:acyl-CoA dehydrogenase family protein [Chitinophagales bacterium]MBP6153807.1 acyl-CoA dehydrogenase family protein [Chitinophagales bacterium]HQV77706.1 acyl-CoA dehydrogenase family protein [Chitinophagales bacterium]HQW78179.1 acyl-CoA dehydrogenase family protein [Chitinophagales bacterium]HRB66570.1 acyl-CoA dehydrogenase family protein [Chitinophagales bacterium]